MRGTAFVPGATERVVRPLVTGAGMFMLLLGLYLFVDVQHPENDIGFIKGVPGVAVSAVGAVLVFDYKAQPIELWRLYRARDLKMPPANLSTWWNLTAAAGRGTLTATLAVCGWNAAQLASEWIFLQISAAFDKARTLDSYIGEGNSFVDGWWCA